MRETQAPPLVVPLVMESRLRYERYERHYKFLIAGLSCQLRHLWLGASAPPLPYAGGGVQVPSFNCIL